MKQLFLFALSFFLCFLTSFKNTSDVTVIKWQATPITVDGNLSDWLLPLDRYSKKSKIGYGLRNDATHLYICFRIMDENMQLKILRTGITVAIDTLGKKNQHISIKYPMPNANSPQKEKGRPTMDAIKNKFVSFEHFASFNGFITGNGISSTNNKNGVTVKINWDETNDMIYEVAIPFGSFWKTKILNDDQNKILALNVKIDAVKRSQQVDGKSGATKSGDGGRPANVGGGRSGGSGRPSGATGRPQNNSQFFETQKFHLKFKLALN